MNCLAPITAVWFALAAVAPAGNPLFAAADPHAAIFDRQLWIYATGGGRSGELFGWSSADFREWRKHGPVFRLEDAAWVKDDGAPRHAAWAPCIVQADGTYFFYYSVGPQNPTPSRIGVASGASPAGPFKDSGRPLLTGGDRFEAIDPMVFKDPRSGRHYFYAGGSAGARLRVFVLKPDMVSFEREVRVKNPPRFTEAPFVHFHRGRYYLSYSHGNFRDSSYAVHYCTGNSPEGPWDYRGVILASDDRHKGPGHHSIFFLPGRSQWLIAYHRWDRMRAAAKPASTASSTRPTAPFVRWS